MKEKENLVKNTIIITIGKLSTQIISFFLLPLYTAKLTPEEYGVYDYITTIGIFLIPVITLFMEESMFRFLIDAKSDQDKKKVITQTIMYIIISTVIFTIVAFIVLKIINYKYNIIFILYIVSAILIAISNALSRGLSKIKLYSVSNLISGILVIILNIVTIVFMKMGAVGLLISSIIANTIVSIFVFIRTNLIQYISIKKIEKKLILNMVKYSIPLIPNSLAFSIISVSDRIIVTNAIGIEQNGIYSIAHKFPSIISAFYGFFSIAWKESASKMVDKEESVKYYNDIYTTMKNIIFSISICLIAVIPIAFPIFINDQYKDAYIHIPILIMSVYFCNIAMFIAGIFMAHKDTKTIGSTTIIAAIINVVINIGTINFIGLYAASISTLVANLFLCECRKLKVRKYIKFEKDINFLFHTAILVLVLIAYIINNIWISIITICVAILYSYYDNKKILSSGLKKVINNVKSMHS